MIKTIKTGVILLAAALLAWLLPWLLAFLTTQPSWRPFTLYSCVVHSFAHLDYDEEGNTIGRDAEGNIYTERQTDSIMPMFYFRQLAAEGRFPKEIEGIPVTPKDAERSEFIFRTSPRDVNRPQIGLYQLLESRPRRLDFESPSDVFRITKSGIEFVDMATNSLDPKKSKRFTAALKKAGFRFPARVIAGNGTTRKEYDNGYFLVDDAYRVFHMKQICGWPMVLDTKISDSLQINQIFVTEFSDKRHFAFLADKDHRFYALDAEDYSLHQIPIGKFDPTNDAMMIIGDMFYWTITLQRDNDERLVAVNARDYSLVDTFIPEEEVDPAEIYGRYLFPTTLAFTSFKDTFVRPRVTPFSFPALILGAFLALVYGLLHRHDLKGHLWQMVGMLILGIYVFLPLIIMERRA